MTSVPVLSPTAAGSIVNVAGPRREPVRVAFAKVGVDVPPSKYVSTSESVYPLIVLKDKVPLPSVVITCPFVPSDKFNSDIPT
jgi:hypothetical protein